jgi:restriction system protein
MFTTRTSLSPTTPRARRRTITRGAGWPVRFPPVPKVSFERLFTGGWAVASVLIPEKKVHEGLLIASTSVVWREIIKKLGADWTAAYSIPAHTWEEIIAGGFKNFGYDEVILTPRSRDFGRDVIAIKKGFGSVKIIGSVKAFRPDHLVDQGHVRELAGVVGMDLNVSKGILATTSDFAPRMLEDELIKNVIPYRVELWNGEQLRSWLTGISR